MNAGVLQKSCRFVGVRYLDYDQAKSKHLNPRVPHFSAKIMF